MSDIVDRLRDWSEYDEGKINDAREEAAAEIERLREALRGVIVSGSHVQARTIAKEALK